MTDFQLGEYRDSNGHSKPVSGIHLLKADGSPIERNENGLTPYEAKVISLLIQIRDKLPAQAAPVAKPKVTNEPVSKPSGQ